MSANQSLLHNSQDGALEGNSDDHIAPFAFLAKSSLNMTEIEWHRYGILADNDAFICVRECQEPETLMLIETGRACQERLDKHIVMRRGRDGAQHADEHCQQRLRDDFAVSIGSGAVSNSSFVSLNLRSPLLVDEIIHFPRNSPA